jgi:hypothetical protein
MELWFIIPGILFVALIARWAHKRAEPPAQVHSPAKRGPDHDPKEVVGSGMEGYSIGR